MIAPVAARNILLAPVRATIRWFRSYPALRVRRARSRGGARWVNALPPRLSRTLGLDGDEVSPLKVEVGCGHHPSPGYVHVDINRSARHLEHVGPVWDLPFENDSVEELLAIHVLEHVHPSDLSRTLSEWHRVLSPRGRLQIHVPNAPEIFTSFCNSSPSRKWALINALFGMYGGADISNPQQIGSRFRSDHQAMYDLALLENVLREAGFRHVNDLTGQVVDRHCEAWAEAVRNFSLVVEASKQSAD